MNGGTGENVESAELLAADRLRGRAADMFVEVQRADGKATVLCGVAGGVLAVYVAMLPRLTEIAGLTAALAVASALLGLALIAALVAIRPVLPRNHTLTGLEATCSDAAATDVVAVLRALGPQEQLRMEASRLAALSTLARKKFRAIKAAVDLTAAALLVAGFASLITYVTR